MCHSLSLISCFELIGLKRWVWRGRCLRILLSREFQKLRQACAFHRRLCVLWESGILRNWRLKTLHPGGMALARRKSRTCGVYTARFFRTLGWSLKCKFRNFDSDVDCILGLLVLEFWGSFHCMLFLCSLISIEWSSSLCLYVLALPGQVDFRYSTNVGCIFSLLEHRGGFCLLACLSILHNKNVNSRDCWRRVLSVSVNQFYSLFVLSLVLWVVC